MEEICKSQKYKACNTMQKGGEESELAENDALYSASNLMAFKSQETEEIAAK